MSEKKKVFISGPMSGIKDFNKPAFDQAEQWLIQAGYSVFNPARMHFDDAWTHEEIMRIDLATLTQCDYICMLDGFESSIGAMQEYLYAMAIGIELFHMSDIERPSRVQRCSGCKYFMLGVDEEPCKSCKPVLYSNFEYWEPKPTSDAPKTCGTCKYNADSNIKPLRPCVDCGPFKNWEPKEDKPPVRGESKDAEK